MVDNRETRPERHDAPLKLVTAVRLKCSSTLRSFVPACACFLALIFSNPFIPLFLLVFFGLSLLLSLLFLHTYLACFSSISQLLDEFDADDCYDAPNSPPESFALRDVHGVAFFGLNDQTYPRTAVRQLCERRDASTNIGDRRILKLF